MSQGGNSRMIYRNFTLPDWSNFNRAHFDNIELPVIEEITARFEEGNELVAAHIPTGVGKSVIAECVRQSLSIRGIYLCTSLTLMTQFEREFTWTKPIRGRANYLPYNFLHSEHPDQRSGSGWAGPTCADCDLDEAGCTYCPSRHACPYLCAKAEAASPETMLVSSNTAYFIGECSSPRSQFSGMPFVICDEADTLEDVIMSQVEVSISARMQRELGLRPPGRKTVESSWPAWFEYAIPVVERKLSFLGDATDLHTRRKKTALERLLDRMTAVAADLEGWVYTGYNDNRIEFKPVHVDKVAQDALWRHGKKFLHMSASILSPEFHVETLGYQGSWAPVFAKSPYDRERRPIYFCPVTEMKAKTVDTAWPKMSLGLETVCELHTDERILVHSVSGNLAQHLANHLENLDRPVFHYRNASTRKEAIANYESTPGSVLIAPSLDRGYDGKDDLVRINVIAKVPFPYMGDKQVEKRMRGPGGQHWYALQTARAIVQMVGRGMRHEDDHMICYVLDGMFQRFYNDWLLPAYGDPLNRKSRLFPSEFMEALQLESTQRFIIRQAVFGKEQQRRKMSVVVS